MSNQPKTEEKKSPKEKKNKYKPQPHNLKFPFKQRYSKTSR